MQGFVNVVERPRYTTTDRDMIGRLLRAGDRGDLMRACVSIEDGYVYLYAWVPRFAVRLFIIDPTKEKGFRAGGVYDEATIELDQPYSRPSRVIINDGFVVIERNLPIQHDSRRGVSAPKRPASHLIDLRPRPASDATQADLPVKDLWEATVAKDVVLQACTAQRTPCTMRLTRAVTHGNTLIGVTVTQYSAVAGINGPGKTTLAVFDLETLKFVNIDFDALTQTPARQAASSEKDLSGTAFASDFDRLFLLGTIDNLVIALARNDAIDLFRYKAGKQYSLGTIAWKDALADLQSTVDPDTLLGVTDSAGVVWNLNDLAARKNELSAQKTTQLVDTACNLGLLSTPPGEDAWRKETGLRSVAFERPCSGSLR
jgi:hypothetical protein